ncbi:hypothetical protein ACQJ12_25925, partial [Klebsiella pneumoniae]
HSLLHHPALIATHGRVVVIGVPACDFPVWRMRTGLTMADTVATLDRLGHQTGRASCDRSMS